MLTTIGVRDSEVQSTIDSTAMIRTPGASIINLSILISSSPVHVPASSQVQLSGPTTVQPVRSVRLRRATRDGERETESAAPLTHFFPLPATCDVSARLW